MGIERFYSRTCRWGW